MASESDEERARGPWRRRLLAAGVVGLVVAVGGATRLVVPGNAAIRRSHRPERRPPTSRALPTTGAAAWSRAGWVQRENGRPGTNAWRLPGPSIRGAIEGYASRTSVAAGQPVTLYVSTRAAGFHVEAYRMGYYGGLGARLVWTSSPLAGALQAPSVTDPVTHLVEARWRPSLSIATGPDWPPGDYLLKLVASDGAQSYVPLTVRDDASRAPLVILNGVTTWAAYNRWGGYNLYQGPLGLFDFAHRARIVSFDRPYDANGDGQFVGNEYGLVYLAESLGLDLAYWTDVDLDVHPERVLAHRALLSLGHDEYWSTNMRAGAEAGMAGGVNLAFFGANAMFRHIRFAPSPLGDDRRIVDYKRAGEDPLARSQPDEATVDWREPPLSNPEAKLLGEQYECNPVKADMVIADAGAWPFAGLGLHDGSKLRGLVGPEYDRADPHGPRPPHAQVALLAHSPVRCRHKASFSDMTYYRAPSGAGVLDTGTSWWLLKLSGTCAAPPCPDGDLVAAITANVLRTFAHSGPAPASEGPSPTRPTMPGLTMQSHVRGDRGPAGAAQAGP